uniref:uncharacterized protein LOC118521529 n=1 Tax=Halichoerus grypus TaxID=9711 RepID=UPI001659082D|nr:uncharacterized protein LOC118521529 [Halichoerus grypus]
MGAGTTGPDGGTEALALDAARGTLLAVLLLRAVKVPADQLRRRRARVPVLVLTVQDARGGARCWRARSRLRWTPAAIRFLRPLGVDFDNVEGCWRNGHFFTRVGVFQEHLLSLLEKKGQRPGFCLLLGTKFTDNFMRKVVVPDWPKIIAVADGSHGETCSVLGLSPDYVVESCNAYGANATITRLDQRQVPTPEIRAHTSTWISLLMGSRSPLQ